VTAPITGRASVPPGPPATPGPPGPSPVPAISPRRVGLGRPVAVQLAVVAVLLSIMTRRAPLIIAVTLVVVLGLVPLFLRVRGRWYTEVLAARRRLSRRRHRGQALAPGYEITGFESVGIGADDHGWFAAVEVVPPGTAAVAVPLDRLAALLVDGSVPVSAVQVVTWSVPAPHYLMPGQSACVESYRQLSVDLFATVPPALTGRTWVALRLDDGDAVERTDGTDASARKVLDVALRRLGRSLTTAGTGHQVLDPARLTAAVATCVGLGRGTEQPVEEWDAWTAGGLAHAAFEVVRWPATVAAETLRELCQVPAAQVVTAIELRRDGSGESRADRAAREAGAGFAIRAVLRVGAVPARLADAARQLTARAGQAGMRLRRLDGEQAPAGYFCAPTGGSRW
jgi:type VII secretion protein EccE